MLQLIQEKENSLSHGTKEFILYPSGFLRCWINNQTFIGQTKRKCKGKIINNMHSSCTHGNNQNNSVACPGRLKSHLLINLAQLKNTGRRNKRTGRKRANISVKR